MTRLCPYLHYSLLSFFYHSFFPLPFLNLSRLLSHEFLPMLSFHLFSLIFLPHLLKLYLISYLLPMSLSLVYPVPSLNLSRPLSHKFLPIVSFHLFSVPLCPNFTFAVSFNSLPLLSLPLPPFRSTFRFFSFRFVILAHFFSSTYAP